MILKLYRTNQPFMLFGVPVIALIMWMMYFFQAQSAMVTDISQPLFFEINFGAENYQLSLMLALIMIVLQALLFNRILSDLELFDRNIHLPAVIYVFTSWMCLEDGSFDVFVFANLFILYVIWFLLSVYRSNDARKEMFNAGFVSGLLYVLVWPLVVITPIFLLGINLLKSFYWREWFLFLLAAFLPLLFLQVVNFYLYEQINFPETILSEFTWSFFKGTEESTLLFLIKWTSILLLLIALFMYLNRFNGVIMKVRKQRQLLLLINITLITLFTVYSGYFEGKASGMLIVPLSYFYSFMLTHTTMRTLLDSCFYGLMILTFFYRHTDFIGIF